jgi:hypothetical protein
MKNMTTKILKSDSKKITFKKSSFTYALSLGKTNHRFEKTGRKLFQSNTKKDKNPIVPLGFSNLECEVNID